MNRWTIQQLNETDNLTFAMCILSERGAGLNSEAPLAKKLRRAQQTIEELRDICREWPELSVKEAIYRAADRARTIEDIEAHLPGADLMGLEPADVLADGEIMQRIITLIDGRDCDGSYWDAVEYAVEQGTKEVLEARGGGQNA